MTGFSEVSQMERHILEELRKIGDKQDTANINIEALRGDVKAMKDDIKSYETHGERLTKLEQQLLDMERARQEAVAKEELWKNRQIETIRWLIALAGGAVIAAITAFFKR